MGVSMRRWMVAAVAATAALTALAPATMGQTNLIPGGLTAVPPTALSPNLAQNPGFEANSGGVPTGWTGGGGWALDQQTTHSGSFSYRWSNGPSSDQPIFLKAGIYNFSAWIKTQGVGSGNAGLRLQVDFRPGGVGQWLTTDPLRGTLKDEGTGQQLSSQDFTASANFVAQIDGSGMQAGRAYQVVFSVVDTASGAVTYTYPAYRVSKVAGSARASMNVSVDAKNRL